MPNNNQIVVSGKSWKAGIRTGPSEATFGVGINTHSVTVGNKEVKTVMVSVTTPASKDPTPSQQVAKDEGPDATRISFVDDPGGKTVQVALQWESPSEVSPGVPPEVPPGVPPEIPPSPQPPSKPKMASPQAKRYEEMLTGEVAIESPFQAQLGDLKSLQQEYAKDLKEIDTKDRFSGASHQDRQVLYKQNREQQTEQAVTSPPSPGEYQSLQVGPEASIEHNDSQFMPVEMSDELLRKLSPFMLQVEPPLVFGENGGFLATQENSIALDTFANASSGFQGYNAARTSLSQSTLAAGVNGKLSSLQQFVTANSTQPTENGKSVQGPPTESSNLGEPAVADMMAAADVAWQLSSIMQIPPLVLLINPSTVQINYTKLQQFQERTRYGYVFHAWGEEQPKLSITARCGAFIHGIRGVQSVSKRDSLAWRNLMNAFHFYRSNGYIYDTVGRSNAHPFVGALSIHYDQWVYYGHMESFSWGHDQSNELGGVEFTMDFTVSAMADTAQQPFVVAPMKAPTPSPSDPRYYGLQSKASNRASNFSIGFNEDGSPRITTQGRVATGRDFGVLVPGGLGPVVEAKTNWTKGHGVAPTGNTVAVTGFQNFGETGSLSGQRQVLVSPPQYSKPFGLR